MPYDICTTDSNENGSLEHIRIGIATQQEVLAIATRLLTEPCPIHLYLTKGHRYVLVHKTDEEDRILAAYKYEWKYGKLCGEEQPWPPPKR